MDPTLEAIKGGGGSIKVGATGTISFLMSKELESLKYASRTKISSRDKSSASKARPRSSANEASSSHSSCIMDKNPEFVRKTKHSRKNHNIPILNAGNVSLDVTPTREKPNRKGPYIVEVVDIKCGHPDKSWASPIANRLKKLSFSKLSETIN